MIKNIPFLLFCALTLLRCSPPPVPEGEEGKQGANQWDAVWDSLPQLHMEGEIHVGFLLLEGMYNTGFMASYDVFQHVPDREGKELQLFTVAPSRHTVTTHEGLELIPGYSFEDSPSIDILVVPGASLNADSNLLNRDLLHWIAETGRDARFVMSFNNGTFLLAESGLLDGRTVTACRKDVKAMKFRYREAIDVRNHLSFVHDGKYITSAGGVASFDSALYLVFRLFGEKAAGKDASSLCGEWEPEKMKFLVI